MQSIIDRIRDLEEQLQAARWEFVSDFLDIVQGDILRFNSKYETFFGSSFAINKTAVVFHCTSKIVYTRMVEVIGLDVIIKKRNILIPMERLLDFPFGPTIKPFIHVDLTFVDVLSQAKQLQADWFHAQDNNTYTGVNNARPES